VHLFPSLSHFSLSRHSPFGSHISSVALSPKSRAVAISVSRRRFALAMAALEMIMWPDKWTATTADGGRSAQFEHTLLLTATGVVPLTGKSAASPLYPWERGAPFVGRGRL
jgi:hypothetical protein